ncbi:MAG: hypothetical protein IJ493_06410 [Clostridia bacterium]|nr:hypothetical protein [Clostridia bacterium]
MKKTLYSLMLSDEVIREIDILAHRMGTSRSALVNQILAEHVSIRTPEQQINDIFRAMEEMISPSRELVPFFEQGAPTMSMKSCLEYKYRPTVRYEVELSRVISEEAPMGSLSVIFRTQSAALIDAMTAFFRLWKRIEEQTLTPLIGSAPEFALYDGRFVRTIAYPTVRGRQRDLDSRELASAISGYVQCFDSLLKAYISGGMSAEAVALEYQNDLSQREILI